MEFIDERENDDDVGGEGEGEGEGEGDQTLVHGNDTAAGNELSRPKTI